MRALVVCGVVSLTVTAAAAAQSPAARRVAILLAGYRGAPTASDVAALRVGARSADSQTARLAIRAMGRLARPAVMQDLVAALGSPFPEVRTEAADAIAQAARGVPRVAGGKAVASSPLAALLGTLTRRLDTEVDPTVRATIFESIGRLPYSEAADVARADQALRDALTRNTTVMDRLGVAKGYEALVRANGQTRPLGSEAAAALRTLFALKRDPPRVRRLALLALIESGALSSDASTLGEAFDDADMQVRALAVRASGSHTSELAQSLIRRALEDPASVVRAEAAQAADPAGEGGSTTPRLAAPHPDIPDISTPLVTVEEVATLESARARITLRHGGVIELALFTTDAPAAVLRFVRLARAGAYRGLSFDLPFHGVARVGETGVTLPVPLPDESGSWPHVRGAVGFLDPRGLDGRIGVHLLDDPTLDHTHAVFGQLLTGLDVLDRLEPGDTIEQVDVLRR
jgi:peptidyl-prolyl cis-trans isomerase B (cyclophilin B)